MKDDVNLYRLIGPDESLIPDMIEQDEDLKKTFGSKSKTQIRIKCSAYSALIRNKDTIVGFVMIVRPNHTYKYEVDLGILHDHRKKGYATKALEIVKQIILHNGLNVEVQTKKNNIGANKSVLKNGFTLCRTDEMCNYYILQEDSKQM